MNPETSRAKADQQHTRLLDGLAESIREMGLAQTQVGDIVRHAHASRRTFYKHFPDKDSCFVALAQRTAAFVMTEVVGAIDPAAEPAVKVDQAIDAYVRTLTTDPRLTLTFSRASLGYRVVQAQREGLEQFAQFVASMTQTDRDRGASVQSLSVERAYMLVSGFRDIVLRAIERNEDPEQAAAEGKAVINAALRLVPDPPTD